MIRSGHHDIPSEPDTPSDTSEVEEDDHEEETHAQAEQAGPEQAASQQEEPHQIQAANPEVPIQSAPPLQQADPQTTTTETPATRPSSDDTPSHPA